MQDDPRPVATNDPLLKAPQVAEMLGVAVATIWKNVATGWLPPPCYVAPKAPRWRLSWLTAALDAKRTLPREAAAERRARKLARAKASIATTELSA
jgi:predicted DNA-binding transcriptional regulator AlpA